MEKTETAKTLKMREKIIGRQTKRPLNCKNSVKIRNYCGNTKQKSNNRRREAV